MMETSSKPGSGLGAGVMHGVALLLACCIAGGGILAARREVVTRRERDRQPQQALAGALQAEVLRLEALYDTHLRRLGEQLRESQPETEAARRVAQGIEGIVRVSWLSGRPGGAEHHLHLLDARSAALLPEPTLKEKHEGLPRPRVRLDTRTVFPSTAGQNFFWIDQPGAPLLFDAQSENNAVVLTIDRAAVEAAMTRHLAEWLPVAFAALQKMGGPDAVLNSADTVLISTGALPRRQPDMLVSVVSRFGLWHVASWDPQETQAVHHLPTLAGSLALAVLVAGCGIGLGVQQRRAARQARQRVSFVNRVSHELRTPMTNILLNLDLIEEAMPDAAAGRFALVREEAGRLSRLIENVLTFSRREEGRLTLQSVACRPARIVDDIARQFEPALARRGIMLEVSHQGPDLEARLDADALAQITANLLSNVEKYAPHAALKVETCQTTQVFVLTVADAGTGIAASHAERIFEPFFRLDDRVQEGVSGTGLGLSIARDLARRMGGELQLLPAEKGARFELRISLTAAPGTTDLSTPIQNLSTEH